VLHSYLSVMIPMGSSIQYFKIQAYICSGHLLTGTKLEIVNKIKKSA